MRVDDTPQQNSTSRMNEHVILKNFSQMRIHDTTSQYRNTSVNKAFSACQQLRYTPQPRKDTARYQEQDGAHSTWEARILEVLDGLTVRSTCSSLSIIRIFMMSYIDPKTCASGNATTLPHLSSTSTSFMESCLTCP